MKPYNRSYMLLKIGRIILKTIIWVLILLILLLFLFDRLVQFRMDDKELSDYFHKQNVSAHIGYYKSRGRDIRYVEVGEDTSKPTLLFIHGAPSSLSYWKSYLSDSVL